MSSQYLRRLVKMGIPESIVQALEKFWISMGLKKVRLDVDLSLLEEEAHGTDTGRPRQKRD